MKFWMFFNMEPIFLNASKMFPKALQEPPIWGLANLMVAHLGAVGLLTFWWKITFWLSHLTTDGKLHFRWAIWRQMKKYLGHLTPDGKLPFGWAIWRQMEN
jgi:hypothetical protein